MKKKGVYKEGPGIPPAKKRKLFQSFCLDVMAEQAAALSKVNPKTADLWYRYWREVIYRSLRQAPRFFGEVEMDQKGFGGSGRKKLTAELKQLAKKLSHREYMEKSKQVRERSKTQVFGILQRGGNVYVHIIKKADKRTLMPIIRLVVEEGSTIYTDKWRAFADLKIDGYTHTSIDHSVEYMDKQGNHTNGIESFWSFCQRRLAKFNGIPANTFPLHLKECEFRFNQRHRESFSLAMKSLIQENPLS